MKLQKNLVRIVNHPTAPESVFPARLYNQVNYFILKFQTINLHFYIL
jgi:hypothetical protein